MRLYAADTESDGLLPTITKFWCGTFAELDHNMVEKSMVTYTDYSSIGKMFTDSDNILVMHNGMDFDAPAVEQVIGVKVVAKVVDTLLLSWYLYPLRTRHGLESWGEEFNVPKVEVGGHEWVDDSKVKLFVHRCEEDVKIQTALWQKIWTDLNKLYNNDVNAIWHLIDHLNFKAKCAQLQERTKWKLDVPKAEAMEVLLSNKFDNAKAELEVNMPEVPQYVKKTFPKKPFKINGDLSATGAKWVSYVKENIAPTAYPSGDPLDYKEEIKVLNGYKAPNAGSHAQIKSWLFKLGWTPESFKHERDKETREVRKVPQIKNQETEELCESIVQLISTEPALEHLREMSIVKHRLGVTKGFLKNVNEEGFVYAAIQGLTNTLRFKHKVCVNLPSVRKPYGADIRGLLIARSSGTELCGSDMSSVEDRTKQHYMWKYDPQYVTDMMTPGFDPHLDMCVSAGLMSKEDAQWYKDYNPDTDCHNKHSRLALIRHGGKTTNYAATYGAAPDTIARAANVDLATGQALWDGYWNRNSSIAKIADNCIVKEEWLDKTKTKWLWNEVAQIWYYLKAEKDRFSTLNQSTATYAFDRWMYYVIEKRPQLTAQFHDEGIWELKKGNREAMTKILKTAIGQVNDELKLNRELDCDVDYGVSYAEIH